MTHRGIAEQAATSLIDRLTNEVGTLRIQLAEREADLEMTVEKYVHVHNLLPEKNEIIARQSATLAAARKAIVGVIRVADRRTPEFDAARAAVRAIQQDEGGVMDWQPIETAPKDGTRILIYEPGEPEYYGIMTAKWIDIYSVWNVAPSEGGDIFPHEIHATHWMPLPLPPEPPHA